MYSFTVMPEHTYEKSSATCFLANVTPLRMSSAVLYTAREPSRTCRQKKRGFHAFVRSERVEHRHRREPEMVEVSGSTPSMLLMDCRDASRDVAVSKAAEVDESVFDAWDEGVLWEGLRATGSWSVKSGNTARSSLDMDLRDEGRLALGEDVSSSPTSLKVERDAPKDGLEEGMDVNPTWFPEVATWLGGGAAKGSSCSVCGGEFRNEPNEPTLAPGLRKDAVGARFAFSAMPRARLG